MSKKAHKTTHGSHSHLRKTLLIYMAVMALLCLFAQVIVSLRDDRIDVYAALALLPAALYYAYFNIVSKSQLGDVRFARLVTHCIGFLMVNLSYHVHALLLLIDSSQTGWRGMYLPEGWFGVLLAMFVIWGFGLLIHMIASVAQGGLEDSDA